jgi:hypothetical protein
MNFDKYLILNIFSYCSYRDVICWQRLNKFYQKSLQHESFWMEYKGRRHNKVTFIMECVYKDLYIKGITMIDNLGDIYDVMGHYIIRYLVNPNIHPSIETLHFYHEFTKEFLYQSPESIWEADQNNRQQFNEYIRQNDGLGEDDYNDAGLPNYYDEMMPETEFDNSYKDVVSIKLKHFFKKEDVVFIGSCKDIDESPIRRKSVLQALPEKTLGYIFSLSANSNIVLVSKNFSRIYLTHTNPPWKNNTKGLAHAVQHNHLKYFSHWSHLAGNRYDIQEMLRLAITANSIDIIKYITSNDLFVNISKMGISIIPSKENLFLAVAKGDIFIMKILLENIKKDRVPKLTKYAKTFNNKDMISFLQKTYNSKLIKEKR